MKVSVSTVLYPSIKYRGSSEGKHFNGPVSINYRGSSEGKGFNPYTIGILVNVRVSMVLYP